MLCEILIDEVEDVFSGIRQLRYRKAYVVEVLWKTKYRSVVACLALRQYNDLVEKLKGLGRRLVDTGYNDQLRARSASWSVDCIA